MKTCPLIIATMFTRENPPTYQDEQYEARCRESNCAWWLDKFEQGGECAIARLGYLVNIGAI